MVAGADMFKLRACGFWFSVIVFYISFIALNIALAKDAIKDGRSMIEYGTASPPFYSFRITAKYCAVFQSACEERSDASPIVFDVALSKKIGLINDEVNAQMASQSKDDPLGASIDMAIEKVRKIQVYTDIASSNLRLTVVRDSKIDYRVVVALVTNSGEVILDNLTNRRLHWKETGDSYVIRQSSKKPKNWASLNLQEPDIQQETKQYPTPLELPKIAPKVEASIPSKSELPLSRYSHPIEWVGYKLTEEVELPIKKQILETTFQIFHPYSAETKRSDYKILETKKQKRVKSKDKLDSDLRSLQIETCRKQKLKKCPVTEIPASSTVFVQNGSTVHSCRHSFHNWLALATELNPGRSLDDVTPAMIMVNYKGEVVYNSAYSPTTLRTTIINKNKELNGVDTEIYLNEKRKTYFNISDYVQFEASSPLAPSYPYRQSYAFEDDDVYYMSGYPGATTAYKDTLKGDTVGDRLVTNTGRLKEKRLFYIDTTNTAMPGNSGGPVIDIDGGLIGIICSGEYLKSSVYKIQTTSDYARMWEKYKYIIED